MRKFLLLLSLILFLPTFAMAETASVDNGYKEKVTAYSVDGVLGENSILAVTETITYDFGNNEKHGIFRYIPAVYKDRLGNPRQAVKINSVTDKSGASQTYQVTTENDSKVIKIGDENELITGIHTYVIKYSINHMISSNNDGDRFRWDAIGTGWTVPLNNVVVKLTGSEKLLGSSKSISCYFGALRSTDICDYQVSHGGIIVAKDNLPAGSGITLDTLYTAGTFSPPNAFEIFFWETHWYYFLPLAAFVVFFSLWYEKGRDPKGHGTIVPMYDPPQGVTPYTSSIIMDDVISKRSLPAAIIALATQGYLKIHRKEVKVLFVSKPEYELELIKPLPNTATVTEQRIMDLFFIGRDRVSLNDLGPSFGELHNKLHSKAYAEVTDSGYFVINPTLSRIIFFGLGIAVLVLGIMTAGYLLLGPMGYASFLIPGIIGLLFAIIMPVKTKQGVMAKEDLLGLKMYIKAAEIDRIKFHNAPAKSPEKFEELLPYAIIFGLEKEWATEFEDIYKTPPTWYDGNIATFSIIGLTHDMSSFTSSIATNTATNSGGGFSGGGGGGGGGGSW